MGAQSGIRPRSLAGPGNTLNSRHFLRSIRFCHLPPPLSLIHIFNEAELIRLMADNQEREFERLGIKFQSLWGRRLQLIDCQNLFCEVDKYARVAHPDVAGISGRTRIKQKFSPTGPLESPWYPPKWGINSKIEADVAGRSEAIRTERTTDGATVQSSLDLGSSR